MRVQKSEAEGIWQLVGVHSYSRDLLQTSSGANFVIVVYITFEISDRRSFYTRPLYNVSRPAFVFCFCLFLLNHTPIGSYKLHQGRLI